MLENIIVPFAWREMARKHGGIIAGGALRDLILDRLPVKDVDIFVFGDIVDDSSPEYMEGFNVKDEVVDGVTYQIIRHAGCETPDDLMDYFDLGICKVYWDRVLHAHADFITDMLTKTITVINNHHFAHDKHLASVASRYPDFKIVKAVDEWSNDDNIFA